MIFRTSSLAPQRRRQLFTLGLVVWATLFGVAGCRTGGSRSAVVDRPLARESRKAVEAFHFGYDDEAVVRHRAALRRAWELDDAEAIANTAYNLAACWAAMQHWEPARQALAEARAELRRSGQSEVDAWLLEAKIARAQGRWEEAAYYADCVVEPLIRRDPDCDRCRQDRSNHWAVALRACHTRIVRCLHPEEEKPDVCDSYQISLAVFRANLAIDRGDVVAAQGLLSHARQWNSSPIDPAGRAEIAATEARLLLLQQRPQAAARRLDEEAEWLRQAGHLRELPMANSAAAEAFLQAGQPVDASERFLRTARLLYGRDDLLASLYFLERSIELAVAMGDIDLQYRAALLLEEIEQANRGRKPSQAIEPEEIDAARAPRELDPLDAKE